MTKKLASQDLCKEIFEIFKRHAEAAKREIDALCEGAQADGLIAKNDYFKVVELVMVRHHFTDGKGESHNHLNDDNADGQLINQQWPKH